MKHILVILAFSLTVVAQDRTVVRYTMKFSDALVLGSTMIKFTPANFLCCGHGCLRGAAYFAATGKNEIPINGDSVIWPWLDNEVPCPPGLRYCCSVGPAKYVINEIAYAVERGEWTIEQALDWIRANEPSEPSEPVLAPSSELVRVGKE
jgi:hypothetical protein